EDTNPSNIDLDSYHLIPEDLEWLDVKVHEIVIQSKRMDLYYKEAGRLIGMGKMYICECSQADFKNYKLNSMACPHRERDPATNMEAFEKMISGAFRKGDVSAVVKTDLNHPNPSIRDWIAFRVKEETHPLTGKTYFAYPMMNFSVAVDDHYLDLTHVIRGKDHLNNTEKQSYISPIWNGKNLTTIIMAWCIFRAHCSRPA
ncbi:glutamyl-tRNA synthetase, partial [mine drainage metagenome]